MSDRERKSNERDPSLAIPDSATKRPIQLVAIAAFVVVNALAPFFAGEVFPYTTSPIFRDTPDRYVVYRVFDEDDRPLRPENYGLQLNYQGRLPGLGAGIMPPYTINEFGKVQTEAIVREKVSKLLQLTSRDVIIVERQVFGAIDDQQVGVIEEQTERWRIESDQKLDELIRD